VARLASPAIGALLANVIDYAGCFPPASLPLQTAVENYREYRNGPFAWMLGRFVVSSKDLAAVPSDLDGALTVISTEDQPRASAIETQSVAHFAKPTYCEVAIGELAAVHAANSFAKLRTGGVAGSSVPPTETVADFIVSCARFRLPFKATAGLHHPIRSMQRLSNAADSPTACMHGFVNVLFAACRLWTGGDESVVRAILEETDPTAFRFDDAAHWRMHTVSAEDVEHARRDFIHSFGSCSFTEPIEELKQLACL